MPWLSLSTRNIIHLPSFSCEIVSVIVSSFGNGVCYEVIRFCYCCILHFFDIYLGNKKTCRIKLENHLKRSRKLDTNIVRIPCFLNIFTLQFNYVHYRLILFHFMRLCAGMSTFTQRYKLANFDRKSFDLKLHASQWGKLHTTVSLSGIRFFRVKCG